VLGKRREGLRYPFKGNKFTGFRLESLRTEGSRRSNAWDEGYAGMCSLVLEVWTGRMILGKSFLCSDLRKLVGGRFAYGLLSLRSGVFGGRDDGGLYLCLFPLLCLPFVFCSRFAF